MRVSQSRSLEYKVVHKLVHRLSGNAYVFIVASEANAIAEHITVH